MTDSLEQFVVDTPDYPIPKYPRDTTHHSIRMHSSSDTARLLAPSKKTKIKEKIGKYTRKTLIGIYLYGMACVSLNVLGSVFSPQVSVPEANKIIDNETENFYLKNKNIKLEVLDEKFLDKYTIRGCTYSHGNTFYVAFDKNDINKFVLYHEIAHTILRTPSAAHYSRQETIVELDKHFSAKQAASPLIQFKEIMFYIYSPEEFFCNTYALCSMVLKK
ncbi:MAG: hypothetical protein WC916_02590 [Candidatus Woesearchaeota archaeon]